jgi:hypothetical protein
LKKVCIEQGLYKYKKINNEKTRGKDQIPEKKTALECRAVFS